MPNKRIAGWWRFPVTVVFLDSFQALDRLDSISSNRIAALDDSDQHGDDRQHQQQVQQPAQRYMT